MMYKLKMLLIIAMDDNVKYSCFIIIMMTPSVPGEFPTQKPVTRSFDVFFDLYPNKRLSKRWWGRWFETPPCPLRRHRNEQSNYLRLCFNKNTTRKKIRFHYKQEWDKSRPPLTVINPLRRKHVRILEHQILFIKSSFRKSYEKLVFEFNVSNIMSSLKNTYQRRTCY